MPAVIACLLAGVFSGFAYLLGCTDGRRQQREDKE